MISKSKLIAIWVVVLIGSGCSASPAAPPPPSSDSRNSATAVEIVIAGLEDSNNYCTENLTESRVQHEACLLLQGSLGLYVRACGGLEGCDKAELGSLRDDGNYRGLNQAAMRDPEFHGYLSLAIANTVPILSSTLLRHYFLSFEPGFENPSTDAEVCLMVRHGICGNHVAVAQALAEQVGLEARDIDFYVTKNGDRQSHTMLEVLIAGKWRLYGTTYGAFWPAEPGSAISLPLESVRAGATRQQNTALLQHLSDPDYLDFLSDDSEFDVFSIVQGEEGVVHHLLEDVEDFSHRPEYVGWSTPRNSSQSHGIQHSFKVPDGWSEIEIFVNGTIGTDLQICASSTLCKTPQESSKLTFARSEGLATDVTITLNSSDDIAYVTLDKVSVTTSADRRVLWQ